MRDTLMHERLSLRPILPLLSVSVRDRHARPPGGVLAEQLGLCKATSLLVQAEQVRAVVADRQELLQTLTALRPPLGALRSRLAPSALRRRNLRSSLGRES
jgi:hypothetical protein